MVRETVEEAIIDTAAEEALQGGGIKKLKDVTEELEGMLPRGEGRMELLSSADKIPMWNIHTGRMSYALTDQLRFQLRKKFPGHHPRAGQRVFSLKPVEVPVGPQLKCWLHPEHEKRGWLDSIGLVGRSCSKDKLPTEYAVRVHMRKRHSTAWDVIVDAEAKEERRRNLEIQQRQMEAMERLASGRQEVSQVEPTKPPNGPTVYSCRAEGCSRFFDTERGRDFHERKEHKE